MSCLRCIVRLFAELQLAKHIVHFKYLITLGWTFLHNWVSTIVDGFVNILSVLCNNDHSRSSIMAKGEDLLKPGDVVEQWEVVRKIGSGGFGEVYEVSNALVRLALKLENAKQTRKMLRMEANLLIKLQGKENFCKFFSSGQNEHFNYVVMQLQGRNLNELRLNNQPQPLFSLNTVIRLGLQMLKAIEVIHSIGYLHGDIKPSNFCIGCTPNNFKKIYLLDFGLSRKYPNKKQAFKGTVRYASVNAHNRKELGRRDDLWSLFYSLVEFIDGKLQWHKIKDKSHIAIIKRQYHRKSVKQMPSPMLDFLTHLMQLKCGDRPDYQMLNNLFEQFVKDKGIKEMDPYDWEETAIGLHNSNANGSSFNKFVDVKAYSCTFNKEKKKPKRHVLSRRRRICEKLGLDKYRIGFADDEEVNCQLSGQSETVECSSRPSSWTKYYKDLSLTRSTLTEDVIYVQNFLLREKWLSKKGKTCVQQ